MAEVVYYYGAQVNNNKVPVSVKLKSFTMSFQPTLESQLPEMQSPILQSFTLSFQATLEEQPAVQSPILQSFTVSFDTTLPDFTVPSPKLQSVSLSADASYYSITHSNVNYVGNKRQPQIDIMHTIHKIWYEPIIQSLVLGVPVSDFMGLNVSGGIPKDYNIWEEVLNKHIRIVDVSDSYITHSFKQNYISNNLSTEYITDSQFGSNVVSARLSLSQFHTTQYIGHVVQSQFGTLKKSIFDYSSLGSTLLTLGFGYKFNFVNVFTRSEIHHVYNLHPEYILRNVDYRRLISSIHSPGITVSDMYTVQTYLWTTYLRVHTSVDIPVDDVSFDVYTQYTIANISAGSSTISVPYTVFYDIGDSIIVTDGTNYYERTITDVTDTAIVVDTPISQDIVNARIYKKVKTNRAYILYEIYTPTLDHYILIKGSHDCTLTVSTPTTLMNINIAADTYKEIQLTYSTESIVMPETAQNRIIVKFGSVTQDYIVQFIKLKAEPLVRPTNTSAIERAVSWFNNMFSDETDILYEWIRGISFTIESQCVNKLIYYVPESDTGLRNIGLREYIAFVRVNIDDITLYKIETDTLLEPDKIALIPRSAILYLSNTVYTIPIEVISSDDDMILAIHKRPDQLQAFAKSTQRTDETGTFVGLDVYVYIPTNWNGTLHRVDLQVYCAEL